MSYYKIYFSPTGGTKKTINIISERWGESFSELDLTEPNHDFSKETFKENDICLIAVPSFGGRVPSTAAERLAKLKGNGAKAVLICVYGNREYEDTLLEMKDILTNSGFLAVSAIASIAEHSIMHCYAAGRPNTEDITLLNSFTDKIKASFTESSNIEPVKVPGNHPYREFGGVPLKPTANRKCNQCGLCAKKCPVQAIDIKNVKTCDAEKCISCMQCISVCPAHARKINPFLVFVLSKKMKKVFSEYKTPELFL